MAAVAQRVKVLPALNDGVQQAALVAVFDDFFGFLLAHLTEFFPVVGGKLVVEGYHQFGVQRIIAVLEGLAAGARAQRQPA